MIHHSLLSITNRYFTSVFTAVLTSYSSSFLLSLFILSRVLHSSRMDSFSFHLSFRSHSSFFLFPIRQITRLASSRVHSPFIIQTKSHPLFVIHPRSHQFLHFSWRESFTRHSGYKSSIFHQVDDPSLYSTDKLSVFHPSSNTLSHSSHPRSHPPYICHPVKHLENPLQLQHPVNPMSSINHPRTHPFRTSHPSFTSSTTIH